MSLSFDKAEACAIEEIKDLTLSTIKTLRQLWLETFDLETSEMNIRKLTQHIKLFCDEIIEETRNRQEVVVKTIQDLHEEASDLRRLLNVDINLSPQKNEPLYSTQTRLDKGLKKLRERLKQRKDQIFELLLEQETLCEELNETPRPLLDDPLPTEDEIADFHLHLDALKAEKNNRIYLIAVYRKDIKSFMDELEMPIRTDEEEYLLNERSLCLSQSNVDRLKKLRDQFVAQMEETRESIENIKNKLEKLWDCLCISPQKRKKISKYTGYSQSTYDRLYKELNRCEAIKRQNIKLFVDKCREEIVDWWLKTMKSDAERSRFTHFTNDWYTEDLLALHEIELEEVKQFYKDNEQIFNLINERTKIWDRMQALETKSLEPGHYNNRGGQLLKEEKERRQISTQLPKIEEQLKQLVHQYEMRNNRKFTVYGDDILEIIQMQWDEKRAKKENQMSARKNAATPFYNRSISVRNPMSLRNQMSSTKKIATPTTINGSTIPLSSKRKLPTQEKVLPASKRNLLLQFGVPKIPVKSPLKKPKIVVGSTIKRRSVHLTKSGKIRQSRNKSSKNLPKIKVNDETTYSSSEEYIHKEPTSRSSVMRSNDSSISKRKNKNALMNKKNTNVEIQKIMRSPSKIQMNDQVSLVTKKDFISRSRVLSSASSASSQKLKNSIVI